MKKLFSIVASLAALAACQPQDLSTTFKVSPAVATVELTVINAVTGGIVPADQIAVSNCVSANDGLNGTIDKVDNTHWTITAGEGKLYTGSVKISVTCKIIGADGETYNPDGETTVKVYGIIGGAKATYTGTIVIGAGYGIEYKGIREGGDEDTTPVYFTPNGHTTIYTHAGRMGDEMQWVYNPSEFILCAPVTYQNVNYKVADEVQMESGKEEYEQIVENVRTGWINQSIPTTDESGQVWVAAWARYSIWQIVATNAYTVAVYAIDTETGSKISDKLGSFDCVDFVAQGFDSDQAAMPGEPGHNYIEGHGHYSHDTSHGSEAYNAGGGIMWAD